MQLADCAREILDRANRIEFFHAVGQPLTDDSVVSVSDWRTALKVLASVASRNYFLDAQNEISGTAFLRNQPEYNKWNKIVEEADKVLVPDVQSRIERLLPIKGKRVPLLANEVIGQIVLAVVERQLRPWHDSDFFLNVFRRLERGHLPCGGTDDFPNGKLLVF